MSPFRRIVSLLRPESAPAVPTETTLPGESPAAEPVLPVDPGALAEYLGVEPRDLALYARALTHRSVLRTTARHYPESNERLEFLGDALLGAYVAEHLYRHYPDSDEGFLTRLRARLVSGRSLARAAERLGLGPLLLLSPNMDRTGGRTNASILADAFEAVLAALYLDHGPDVARAFVTTRLLKDAALEDIAQVRENHKSMLLEFAQARGWAQPVYRVVDESGPSHAMTFHVEVLVEGARCGGGTASSKKRAEQRAAKEALATLEKSDEPPVAP